MAIRGGLLYLALLVYVIVKEIATDSITSAPTTFFFVIIQTAIHLDHLELRKNNDPELLCMSVEFVLRYGDVMRMFLATFAHLDTAHLFYNMCSFISKGRMLEAYYGSGRFFAIILTLGMLQSILYIGMEAGTALAFKDPFYLKQCALGFSGVIFALKVLSHYNTTQPVVLLKIIPLPSKWALWIELVVIQCMVPSASFIGHFAGIVAGLLIIAYEKNWYKLQTTFTMLGLPWGAVAMPMTKQQAIAGNDDMIADVLAANSGTEGNLPPAAPVLGRINKHETQPVTRNSRQRTFASAVAAEGVQSHADEHENNFYSPFSDDEEPVTFTPTVQHHQHPPQQQQPEQLQQIPLIADGVVTRSRAKQQFGFSKPNFDDIVNTDTSFNPSFYAHRKVTGFNRRKQLDEQLHSPGQRTSRWSRMTGGAGCIF